MTIWTGEREVTMDEETRPPVTVVVARNRQWFEHWCRFENDPPLNPRGRSLVPLTSLNDAQRLRGRRRAPGDRLLVLGFPVSRQDHLAIREALFVGEWWD